jgi:hypothetical protein
MGFGWVCGAFTADLGQNCDGSVVPFESIYTRTGACSRFFLKGFWQETAVLHGAQMSVEMKPLPNELINALMTGFQTPEDLMG